MICINDYDVMITQNNNSPWRKAVKEYTVAVRIGLLLRSGMKIPRTVQDGVCIASGGLFGVDVIIQSIY